MKKDFKSSIRSSGSDKNEPKIMNKVQNQSNEPLATELRNRKMTSENVTNKAKGKGINRLLFKDFLSNTELGVDLNLPTCKDGGMDVGA